MEKLDHKFGNDGVRLAALRVLICTDSEITVLLDIIR